MKMEHVLKAQAPGTVSLRVGVGTQVAADEVVATIIPIADPSEITPENTP